MKQLRLFIALEVPPHIRHALASSFLSLNLPAVRVRAVSEENIHLTIKFIGEMALPTLPSLIDVFNRFRSLRAVLLNVQSCILLPSRSPRTIAVTTTNSGDLATMMSFVDAELSRGALAQPERRRSMPHLTLARIREPLSARDLKAVEDWTPLRSPWTADTLTLFESALSPHGPQYTPLVSLYLS